MSCNCNNTPCICASVPELDCNPCITTDICKEKFDLSCIVYNFNKPEEQSGLSCFLNIPSNTNLKTIFEILDEKLCNLTAIQDINFVNNDCISWTKTTSESGVITMLPILDIECLITNLSENVTFCQRVADCAVSPPSCFPVSNIEKVGSSTNSLIFSWSPVLGALSYDVKLFTDFTYTTQVGGTQTILHPLNTATFTGLSSNTSYYVQIRVTCTNTLTSSITSSGPFLTDSVPDISCPSVAFDSVIVTNNSVTAMWTGDIAATSYNIYINGVLQAGMPTVLNTFTKSGLPNNTYSIKVEALPCVGIPQSDTDSFVINYNAPSITLNCAGITQISGSFQEGLSSNGTIRIPVTVTGSDLVNVSVSGTGITGSITNYVVSTFTTYIDIPITYNGSSPSGSRVITVSVVGSLIASTSCNGSVNIVCPTCSTPNITITNTTSSGFTVGVTPLALGDTYNLIISESGGPVVINLTGQTVNYSFIGGNPSTIYTISVTKVCDCGNNSVTTNTSTTTSAITGCVIWQLNAVSTDVEYFIPQDCAGSPGYSVNILNGAQLSVCMPINVIPVLVTGDGSATNTEIICSTICDNYYNNTGLPVEVVYTNCSGNQVGPVNVGAGQDICVLGGSSPGGSGGGFLQLIGIC